MELYASLAALRTAHRSLLQERRQSSDPNQQTREIMGFIEKGCRTGMFLTREDERWEAQNLLDYWSNELYHLTKEDINATLEEYDPEQAPELADKDCPYIGLDPFDLDDQSLFFGRDPFVRTMIETLAGEQHFLALSGPSGSGKTSLILAGLFPQLKNDTAPGSQAWHILPRIVPSYDPLQQLAYLFPDATAVQFSESPATLTHQLNQYAKKETAVLFIDQFEELYTLCQNEEKRQATLQNLLHLITHTRHILIIAIRTDLEGNLMRSPDFYDAYLNAQLRVTTMNAAELRQTILQPAELVGLKFEDGLIDQLVSDVLGEPTALPLLQFTMLKLWEKRERNLLTWEAYKQLGGGRKALSTSADQLFNSLNPTEQRITQNILLKMVRPTQGLDIVRIRVLRKQLYEVDRGTARVDRVIDYLIEERLLRLIPGDIAENDQIEIAHEALVTNWPRLVGWLEDDRVTLRRRLRLTEMAEQWEAHGRDRSALLRGVVLEEAEQYTDLNDLENTFVFASKEELNRQQREREAAQQQELAQTRRINRRLTMLSVALTAVILIAFLFALLAMRNAVTAENNAATAVANQETAQQSQSTAQALAQTAEAIAVTAESAKQAAITSANIAATAEAEALNQSNIAQNERDLAEQSAQEALAARATAEANETLAEQNARIAQARELANNAIAQLASDPQLSLLLALEALNRTTQISQIPPQEATDALYRALEASQQVLTFAGHTSQINDAAVSTDGRYLLTGGNDRIAILWNITTGQAEYSFTDLNSNITAVAFHPNNIHAAAAAEDGRIYIWDITANNTIRRLVSDNDGAPRSIAFNPDGSLLVVGYDAGTTRLWDTTSGVSLQRQFNHTGPVQSAIFTPNGGQYVTAGSDGRIIFTNTTTGSPINGFEPEIGDNGRAVGINHIAFSPDGAQLAAAKDNGLIRIYTDQQLTSTIPAHRDAALGVAFSPDGAQLATSSAGGVVRVWDAATNQQIVGLAAHNGLATAVVFTTDSSQVISTGQDEVARSWLVEPAIKPLIITGHRDGVNSVVYNSDGSQLLTGSSDQTARTWDAITGQQIATYSGHDQAVNAALFQHNSNRITTASSDNNVRFWNTATGEVLFPFYSHTAPVNDLTFTTDGLLLATAAQDGSVRLWDATSNTQLALWENSQPARSVAFSPDGQLLAAAIGETAVIYNISTGEPSQTLAGETGILNSVAFSPDGAFLATASANGIARLWALASGEVMRSYAGHSGPVLDVAFSSDGRQLATASVDKTVRLWDAATGQSLRTILGHALGVTAVTFSPNDAYVASASLDGSVQITPLYTVDDLLTLAQARLIRSLSPGECAQYLHGDSCLTTP
jgi:WD40 repeat protein